MPAWTRSNERDAQSIPSHRQPVHAALFVEVTTDLVSLDRAKVASAITIAVAHGGSMVVDSRSERLDHFTQASFTIPASIG